MYHKADFDGIFCREIAKHFIPDAVLIGWDYGDPVPTPDVVSASDDLYMLDISVEGLMGHPRLVWIDHHKSAMDKFPPQIKGYRIDGVAACRLAWQWFSTEKYGSFNASGAAWWVKLPYEEEYIQRTVSEPKAVRLAGEYDIWDKRDPEADLFQHGLRSEDLKEDAWIYLLDEDQSDRECNRLLGQGKVLQYARTKENESIITRLGFTVNFEGLIMLACNHAMFNSHLFTAGVKPEHEALLGFKFDGQQWSVSLYHAPGKEHHDLSDIAKRYGGGGHRGACGFRTKSLPFIK